MNSKLFTLFLIYLGLFLAALSFRRGDLLWLGFPLLAYMLVGLFKFPAANEVRLQAHRQISQVNSPEGTVLEVEVSIRNHGAAIPYLFIDDQGLDGMRIISGQKSMRTTLLPGEEATIRYSFLKKRGRYAWVSIHTWVGDPFGLIGRTNRLPAQGEVSVEPQLDNFRRLPLRPDSTFHSPGPIPARKAGAGTDFWGVRLYQPGDSLRWIDWRLNARHPNQLFTKEFEQEEIADIGLILDARKETDLSIGEESLFEHSVHAAASLADGFIHQGHRVSLLVLRDRIIRVFPGCGKNQLNRIMRCLSGVESGSKGKLIGFQYLPLRMFSSHSLLVLLSPLARSDSSFFPSLRASGYHDFSRPVLTEDRVNWRAFRLARQERAIQLRMIARLQIQVIDWQVSQPLYPLVQSALSYHRGHQGRRGSYGS